MACPGKKCDLGGGASCKEVERYYLAMESVNEGFWDWDLITDEVYFSPSCCTMLGYAPDEPDSVDGVWLKYVHPVDKVVVEEELRHAAATMDYPYAVTFRMRSKHEGWRWIFSRGRVIAWDAARKPLRMIGTNFDFTERKLAEDRLRESERRLSALMNNLPGIAYRSRCSPARELAFVSKGCRKLTGYAAEALVGDRAVSLLEIVHPEDKEMVQARLHDALAEGKAFELVYRILTPGGGSVWVMDQGEAVFSDLDGQRMIEGYLTDVTLQKEAEISLRQENVRLKSSMKAYHRFGDIVGRSPAMQEVYRLIERAADSDVNTIIYGESGTGKELVARAIHQMSKRSKGSFVVVNCAAIPESLLESEFFGYKKGAFTGAAQDREGFLEAAHRGTLFLDEVGELPPAMQAKLLRVLEGHGYCPVGGREVKNVQVRVVAATNRDLKQRMADRKMREDFYYRLHILPIRLPPLRHRREDIPLLIDCFLDKFGEGSHSALPEQAVERLTRAPWTGNVRELFNVLHRFLAIGHLDFLGPRQQIRTGETGHPVAGMRVTLHEALITCERDTIRQALEANHWRRDRTAADLGISVRSLHRKMRRCQLT